MPRTTLRKLTAIAGVLIVGIGLGVGGAWALDGTDDRPVTVNAYELSENHFGVPEITVWVTAGHHATFTL